MAERLATTFEIKFKENIEKFGEFLKIHNKVGWEKFFALFRVKCENLLECTRLDDKKIGILRNPLKFTNKIFFITSYQNINWGSQTCVPSSNQNVKHLFYYLRQIT